MTARPERSSRQPGPVRASTTSGSATRASHTSTRRTGRPRDGPGSHPRCLTDPAEDTPRLALADWLDESGSPGYQAGGRFLRGGVLASRFRGTAPIDDPAGLLWAAGEIHATARRVIPPLLRSLGLGCAPDWLWDADCDVLTVRHEGLTSRAAVTFTRGMLSGLKVTADTWTSLGSVVLARCPLDRVEVLDVPGLVFTVEPPNAASGLRLWATLEVLRWVVVDRGVVQADDPATCWSQCHGEAGALTHTALVSRVPAAKLGLIERLATAAGHRWPSPRESPPPPALPVASATPSEPQPT